MLQSLTLTHTCKLIIVMNEHIAFGIAHDYFNEKSQYSIDNIGLLKYIDAI